MFVSFLVIVKRNFTYWLGRFNPCMNRLKTQPEINLSYLCTTFYYCTFLIYFVMKCVKSSPKRITTHYFKGQH